MMNKYTFKKPATQLDKMLLCPKCTETLSQIDISSFGTCPYCEYKLSTTPELEDFLLKPAVDHWVSLQRTSIPADYTNLIIPDEELYE